MIDFPYNFIARLAPGRVPLPGFRAEPNKAGTKRRPKKARR